MTQDGTIDCILENSHCGGKKIDLRRTAGLESMVEMNFVPMPPRDFDRAPQWRDPNTNHIYALEPTHWDILIP